MLGPSADAVIAATHQLRCALRPAEKIYLAHSAFLSRLLVDWRIRTEDPWDADLFYVPALT